MKVIIQEIPKSFFTGFTLLREFDREGLARDKRATVTANTVSQTRVSTDIQYKDTCLTINVAIPGFKLDMVSKKSTWSDEYVDNYYFKKLKKQDKEIYLKYLEKLVIHVIKDYLKIEIEEVNISFIDNAFAKF
ncbi:hypothetical protein [Dysgonomonas sp. ZJ709]|uniref:hypothetical protein n=1 Tax=Dysgonomonas sp. ZJ709 TaxID=2709797 RepID=UPI0013EE0BAE|nr:hypothetical protein [Dysgonomonas sp. ZJ709]